MSVDCASPEVADSAIKRFSYYCSRLMGYRTRNVRLAGLRPGAAAVSVSTAGWAPAWMTTMQ